MIFIVSLNISFNLPNRTNSLINNLKEFEKIQNRPSSSTDFELSTSANVTFEGNGSNSGQWVSSIGDVNSDGHDDFAISDPNSNSLTGAVYIYYGTNPFNLHFTPTMNLELTCNASFIGENTNDRAGWKTAAAGDVNNDGYDDFLITALMAHKIYLILGNNSLTKNTNLIHANASFVGEADCGIPGDSLCGAGDINDDGFDDFLIGDPEFDTEIGLRSYHGRVYLFYGGVSFGKNTNLGDADYIIDGDYYYSFKRVGGAIATGDINNDGYIDIITGAPAWSHSTSGPGKIYIIYGGRTLSGIEAPEDYSNATINGLHGQIGYSISVGNFNGDSYDDIALGSPTTADSTGEVFIFYGGEFLNNSMDTNDANVTFTGENISDFAGYSISLNGDHNEDGYDDLLVGAYGYEVKRGKSYLFYGNATEYIPSELYATHANMTYLGTTGEQESGRCLTLAGDYNSDGRSDLLIGSP